MSDLKDASVNVEHLSKVFKIFTERNQSLKATVMKGRRSSFEVFHAVKDVSFVVPQGSTFGIVGSNGSGKSTLLKCLAGILHPDAGKVEHHGRLVALLELGAGFHPELSGRENVYLNGTILGMSHDEIDSKFASILEFSGIERFIDMPVKNYSSGMVVRLGFSIAIHVDPDILVIDEVLAVGDERFQSKCYDKIREFRQKGKTIILVSHSLGSIAEFCDHALWLDSGEVSMLGSAADVIAAYSAAAHTMTPQTPTEIGIRSHLGSGEVLLRNARLTDGQGEPIGVIAPGAPLQVEFGISNSTFVGWCYVRMSIVDGDRRVIWQSGSRDLRIRFDLDGNTERLITCFMKSMPILEGIFSISLSVLNESGSILLDHVDEVARFNVIRPSSGAHGLLLVDTEWVVR